MWISRYDFHKVRELQQRRQLVIDGNRTREHVVQVRHKEMRKRTFIQKTCSRAKNFFCVSASNATKPLIVEFRGVGFTASANMRLVTRQMHMRSLSVKARLDQAVSISAVSCCSLWQGC